MVSQSGGLAFALFNHAQDRGLGVGAVVSTGNEVDLGWADYVDYLLDQPGTRVVLGFVEALRQSGPAGRRRPQGGAAAQADR